MQKKQIFILFFVLCCLTLKQTLSAQTVETVSKHVRYLSSDALEGRLPCTRGDSMAADYVKKHFESKNVIPFESGYYQYFNINIGVVITPKNELVIGNRTLKLFEEFEPISVSTSGIYQSALYDVSFDSLKNGNSFTEAASKWIAVEMPNYRPSIKEYMRWASKVSKDSVQGILFIVPSLNNWEKNNPFPSYYTENQIIRTQYKGSNNCFFKNTKGDISKILFSRSIISCNIPLIMITQKAYENVKNKSSVSTLNNPVSTLIDIKQLTGQTQNIMGSVRGTERPDEYIIVGAHIDHLGHGGHESGSRDPERIEIHHGADDNASGTATVLGLASRLAANPLPVSVIFAIFGAEEIGLLGSYYMTQNLPVDKNKIKAMLNYDMVGRMRDNNLNIGGVGTAYPFKNIIDSLETEMQINTSAYGSGPSDHASFNSEQIPVLYFNTGVHIDYHTPDDVASKINYQGIMSIINYSESLLKILSKPRLDLTYLKTETEQLIHATRTSLQVSLGIIPDVTGSSNAGLKVMGVTTGGNADKAEIKKGDIIIDIDNTRIKNIYDYMEKLQQISPNQTTHITIERDKEKKMILIRF